jgi:fluoride ion exporter CrcB/FEX
MTTFSTFTYETWDFIREGDVTRAGVYAVASLLGAYLAFATGHAIIRALER